jgi:hypothetical protein
MGVCLKCKLDPCQCDALEDIGMAQQDASEDPPMSAEQANEE